MCEPTVDSRLVPETNAKGASPAPAFGPYYFAHDRGAPYERSDHWLSFFGAIADRIVRELQPSSVLDAGCAKGFLVEQLRERGVDASGIDVSEHAIAEAHESVRDHCRVASLTEPLDRRYDLITCIEVLEHLPAAEARAAVEQPQRPRPTGCCCRRRRPTTASPRTSTCSRPSTGRRCWPPTSFLRDLRLRRQLHHAVGGAVHPPAHVDPRGGARLRPTWWRLRHEIRELRERVVEMQGRLEELSDAALGARRAGAAAPQGDPAAARPVPRQGRRAGHGARPHRGVRGRDPALRQRRAAPEGRARVELVAVDPGRRPAPAASCAAHST